MPDLPPAKRFDYRPARFPNQIAFLSREIRFLNEHPTVIRMMAEGIEGTVRVDVHQDAALRQDSMEGELNSILGSDVSCSLGCCLQRWTILRAFHAIFIWYDPAGTYLGLPVA